MKYNFCTLFDSNYLLKGLALHASLIKYCPQFHLWILCMDDQTHALLSKLNLKNVSLVSLAEFEDPELLQVKPGRKKSEYCWTCTSSLILYVLKQNPSMDMIAYLDADLYFYASPEPVYDELGADSILIIPHNFSDSETWREKTSGIYNVGMLIFRNNAEALKCLTWWRERCLEWCFDYYEDGKLGDQLYLNDWPNRFNEVCISKHLGADVASWNIKQFIFSQKDSGFLLTKKKSGKQYELLFYHFHGLNLYLDAKNIVRAYPITVFHTGVYKRYVTEIHIAYQKVRNLNASIMLGFKENLSIIKRIKQFLLKVKRDYL